MSAISPFQEFAELTFAEKIAKKYYDYYQKNINLFLLRVIIEENMQELSPSEWDCDLTRKKAVALSDSLSDDLTMDFVYDDKLYRQWGFASAVLPRYINIPLSKKSCLQVLFIICGSCIYNIGDKQYHLLAGDMIDVSPDILYELHPSGDCFCICTEFRPDIVMKLFQRLLIQDETFSIYLQGYYSAPANWQTFFFHDCIDPVVKNMLLLIMKEQQEQKKYAEDIISGLWLAVKGWLLQNYREKYGNSDDRNRSDETIQEVTDYIYNHYQTITLAQLSEHFAYNKSYLSTLISSATGYSFREILQKYRMYRAEILLKTTDISISKVCAKVGYKDVSQFVRSFREIYGVTPGDFRRNNL